MRLPTDVPLSWSWFGIPLANGEEVEEQGFLEGEDDDYYPQRRCYYYNVIILTLTGGAPSEVLFMRCKEKGWSTMINLTLPHRNMVSSGVPVESNLLRCKEKGWSTVINLTLPHRNMPVVCTDIKDE